MIKTYLYNAQSYSDESALRNAIFEKDRVVFGPEPAEGKAQFWSNLDVTYSEAADPEPTLEELKEKKLKELDRAFYRWRNTDATLVSSLGFTADADQRAMIDVSGLVALDAATTFMDADNQPHELTAEQIKTLHREIIQSGNQAYQDKWGFRTLIKGAEDAHALEKIEIEFAPVSFTGGNT